MFPHRSKSGDSLTAIEVEPKHETIFTGSNPPFGARFSVLKMGRPSAFEFSIELLDFRLNFQIFSRKFYFSVEVLDFQSKF